jgi:hypothetical protein
MSSHRDPDTRAHPVRDRHPSTNGNSCPNTNSHANPYKHANQHPNFSASNADVHPHSNSYPNRHTDTDDHSHANADNRADIGACKTETDTKAPAEDADRADKQHHPNIATHDCILGWCEFEQSRGSTVYPRYLRSNLCLPTNDWTPG